DRVIALRRRVPRPVVRDDPVRARRRASAAIRPLARAWRRHDAAAMAVPPQLRCAPLRVLRAGSAGRSRRRRRDVLALRWLAGPFRAAAAGAELPPKFS